MAERRTPGQPRSPPALVTSNIIQCAAEPPAVDVRDCADLSGRRTLRDFSSVTAVAFPAVESGLPRRSAELGMRVRVPAWTVLDTPPGHTISPRDPPRPPCTPGSALTPAPCRSAPAPSQGCARATLTALGSADIQLSSVLRKSAELSSTCGRGGTESREVPSAVTETTLCS